MMGLLLNFGMFKIGWLSSVIGGAQQLPWLGPLAMLFVVAIHLYRAEQPERELILVLSCGFIGAVFDSVLVAAGWVTYPSGLFVESMAPYWIISMWMLFATTLNVSLRWMRGRYLLAVALGAVAGPMAYIGGSKLGGIVFLDRTAGLVALSIGWAVIMPVLVILAERLDGISPGIDAEAAPAELSS
jgi:hypothetical protein